MEQIRPFEPQFHLKQQASALDRLPDGRWRLETDAGTVLEAPVVVIAAGAGSFVPRRLPLPGAEGFEGTLAVLCRAQDGAVPRPPVLVAGGGDSALDWVLNLEPIAASMALVHRRDDFRAAPELGREDAPAGRARAACELIIGQITGLEGEAGMLQAVTVKGSDGRQGASTATRCSPSTA